MMDPMTDAAQQYEVEVKTLLGDQTAAKAFLEKLKAADPQLSQIGESSQLNHYFDEAGDPTALAEAIRPTLEPIDYESFRSILERSQTFALRTRQDSDGVKLVIKAAKDGEDVQHAVERLEGEYLTDRPEIDQLDRLIQKAGYGFLSKWSRDRKEFRYKDYTVTLDRNAGYGYLAEFERLVTEGSATALAKQAILDELARLGLAELSQERVGRMFAHYNQHWPDYYRTDKTFVIE